MLKLCTKLKPIFFKFAAAVLVLSFLPVISASALDQSQVKAQLEKQLQEIEAQIQDYEQELRATQDESKTLANKLKELRSRQAALHLQISATNIKLQDINSQLEITQAALDENQKKNEGLQVQLSSLVLSLYEQDEKPLIFALVGQDGLAGVFAEVNDYTRLSDSLRGVLAQTKAARRELEAQAQLLSEQQDEAQNLLSVKVVQQQELSGRVQEQDVLLKQTKGRENDYQIVLNDTRKRAAQIRGRIYELFGVSAGQQINFGEAVQIAQWASTATGTRAAFLLAVLTQESNLGKNVGTCNRPGDPAEKSWRNVMKPERDQVPFQTITQDLGLNTDTTPVSCPMRDSRGRRLGWGGAMGPAQFLPSTWLGYKDQVAAITGKFANPWDIRDAFLAAAIKLRAGGADGTDQGDWNAAMRYFSGSVNLKYRFYGDNVLELTRRYENDIADLSK